MSHLSKNRCISRKLFTSTLAIERRDLDLELELRVVRTTWMPNATATRRTQGPMEDLLTFKIYMYYHWLYATENCQNFP